MSDTSVNEGDASVNVALLCPLLAFCQWAKGEIGLIKKWQNDTLLAPLHQAPHMNEPLTNSCSMRDCQNKHSHPHKGYTI